MLQFTPFTRPAVTILALAILVFALPCAAQAQSHAGSASFQVTVGGTPRTVNAATRAFDERPYADLQGLAEALGAGFAITASQVQVDLAGGSAWVYLNDNQVNASAGQFALTHPVVQRDGRAWLALPEVPAFFRQAFGVTLTVQAPQNETEPDPLLDLDVDLLTPDAPTAPAEDEPLADEPILDEPPLRDEPDLDPLQEITPDAVRDLRTARGPERVIIDPAHGGEDTGVIGPGGVMEKDVVLRVAQLLRERLSGRIGREVVLTRDDDRPLDAAQRTAQVANPSQTLFISLQCGGSMARNATGPAFFFLPDIADASIRQLSVVERQRALEQRSANATASRRLAERIERALVQETGASSRGVRGVASRVLLAADSPGVIIELGCLTSEADEERLRDSGYQEQLASVIAEAILAHYGLAAGDAR